MNKRAFRVPLKDMSHCADKGLARSCCRVDARCWRRRIALKTFCVVVLEMIEDEGELQKKDSITL
jgi:hypothetical protein